MTRAQSNPLVSGVLGGVLGTVAMATGQVLWNRVVPVRPDVRRLRDRRAGVGAGHHAQPMPRSHTQRRTAGEQLVDRLAKSVVGRRPSPRAREAVSSALHYAFGAAAGTLYATLARRYPVVTAGRGAVYGLAVWVLAEEIGMPALLGVGKSPAASPLEEHAYVAVSHVFYGLALESARRVVESKME
jgi:hypothetical protein